MKVPSPKKKNEWQLTDQVLNYEAFTNEEWDLVISRHWDNYNSGKPYPKEYEYEYIDTEFISGWILKPCAKQLGRKR